ncbi:uncharacterized protein [Drosophila kikkawai]|uniref:Uncharacterized protein n=1 Tax=Drosophila kikkawai TaxID=30033 RepID=A0ABM4GPD5_DROKI
MSSVMQCKGLALLSMSRLPQSLFGALVAPLRNQLYHKVPRSYPRPDLMPPERTNVTNACWQTEYKWRSYPEFKAKEAPGWDLTHYKPQNMLTRQYPRTWNECTVKGHQGKVQCIPLPPNPPRRQRKDVLPRKTHCTESKCVLDPSELCQLMKPPNICKRLKVSNCSAEPCEPLICQNPLKTGYCERRKTKYPCFSECCHDSYPDLPSDECTYLVKPTICRTWKYYNRERKR